MSRPNLSDWFADFLPTGEIQQVLDESENRIRRAYAELVQGYNANFNILNVTAIVPYGSVGPVVVRDIPFYSICGHHMLPYFGTFEVEYLPGAVITGLGKLPRLVDLMARRMVIQERLTQEVAEEIARQVNPRMVRAASRATHMCMVARGPRSGIATTECEFFWRSSSENTAIPPDGPNEAT